MLVKIHKSYRDVIAVCDSELLGRIFKQKNIQLDLSGEFFKGEEKTESEVVELLQDLAKEDATFNIIGKNSVNCALKAGIISKQGIKRIKGIPFALVLL